jgi:ketosteroid isomerase-like protein
MLPTIIALLAAIGTSSSVAAASDDAADTKELSRLEQVWNEAHIEGDANALDALWADDLVVTVPRMPSMSKPDSLAIWRSGQVKFMRYQTSDLTIRVYGDAAVVTGRLQRTRDFKGKTMNDDWRFTKIYIRRDGKWKVVAFHASEAPPETAKQ